MVPALATVAVLALLSPASQVVLGSAKFGAPTGSIGFGHAHPGLVNNGGDPAGEAMKLHWTHWGEPVAYGTGLGWANTPVGGYYPTPVTIELRAFDIGRCTRRGPKAYRRLDARIQTKPGGKLSQWEHWNTGTICHAN